MSAPSPTWFPWLRKLSVHLWAFAQYARASLLFVPQIAQAKTLEQRNRLFTSYIRTLLDIADALIHSSPKTPVRRWKRRSLLRSWYYSHVLLQVVTLPRDWQSGLSTDDLLRIARLGEVALGHYESGGVEIIGATRKWKRFGAIAGRQMRCVHHAFFHTSLASLYLRMNAGDLSRNLESAFTHYRAAADILEQGNLPVLSLYAAAAWAALGTACLNYPTENRADYARQALEAFGKAKEIAALHGSTLKASMPEIWNDQFFSSLSFIPRVKYSARFSARLALGARRMAWRGVPDPSVMGTLLPFFMLWVDWQLGIAYRQLGQLEKAVEHFELALQGPTRGTEDFEGLRAAVEVDRGYAYLGAQSGEPRKNLDMATESFNSALTRCEKAGVVRSDSLKPYALALVGDAHLYFALDELGAITPEQHEQFLPMLTNQLRSAARIARTIAVPQLTQEALFLLGKGYELQGDYVRAYRALALASRVADRLERRARTPRLLRYLVGTEAQLDELLVRVALQRRSLSEKASSYEGDKVKPVPLHAALRFAERGRTAFLATQLRSLNLLPKGGTNEEVKKLFERRRLWHEAELKLLEQEAAPIADTKALITLRERRNVRESSYFAELERVREEFADPYYNPDHPILPLSFAKLRTAIWELEEGPDTAFVEYYFTDQDLVVFVLLPTVLHCAYINISLGELKDIEEHWQRGFEELPGLKDFRRDLTHWGTSFLLQVLDRLKPVVEFPARTIHSWEREADRRIKRIVIVPHRFLHLIPLHAVELSQGGRWSDMASIQYVPSASVFYELLLSRILRRKRSADPSREGENHKAICVSYSSLTDKVPCVFNIEEARAVAEATGGEILSGREATPRHVKEVMRKATYIHFACHGVHKSDAPLSARLELAPDPGSSNFQSELLRYEGQTADDLEEHSDGHMKLTDIFRSVRLVRHPLVVLSACETGRTKIEERHEEYIGLPAGFLYGGASTVVSTLWRVNDVATWLLMRAFASEIAAGIGPSVALRRAQQELRSLSLECVQREIGQVAEKESDATRRKQMIEESQKLRPLGEFPFASPYWWAGFTINGL